MAVIGVVGALGTALLTRSSHERRYRKLLDACQNTAVRMPWCRNVYRSIAFTGITLLTSGIANSIGPLPTRTPIVTRKDAVEAGFVFPAYVNRYKYRQDLERSTGHIDDHQFDAAPDALTRVFVNPSMTLEEIDRRFRAREGKSAADNLKLAFYGLPEYVLPWFRVGNAASMVLNGAGSLSQHDFEILLEAVRLRFPDAEISPAAGENLITMLRNHREGLKAQDLQWMIKTEQELLALASEADDASRVPSEKEYLIRAVTSFVVLSIALLGFVVFRERRTIAVVWLLFFVVALPPAFALIFESHKLKGQNLVEMYRVGVTAIPYIGKLVPR